MFRKNKDVISIPFSKGLKSRYSLYFNGSSEEIEEPLKMTVKGQILVNTEHKHYDWCYKFFNDVKKLSTEELEQILTFLKQKYPQIKDEYSFSTEEIQANSEENLSEMIMIMAIPVELERRKIR